MRLHSRRAALGLEVTQPSQNPYGWKGPLRAIQPRSLQCTATLQLMGVMGAALSPVQTSHLALSDPMRLPGPTVQVCLLRHCTPWLSAIR